MLSSRKPSNCAGSSPRSPFAARWHSCRTLARCTSITLYICTAGGQKFGVLGLKGKDQNSIPYNPIKIVVFFITGSGGLITCLRRLRIALSSLLACEALKSPTTIQRQITIISYYVIYHSQYCIMVLL